jgi:hypothetical protein
MGCEFRLANRRARWRTRVTTGVKRVEASDVTEKERIGSRHGERKLFTSLSAMESCWQVLSTFNGCRGPKRRMQGLVQLFGCRIAAE